MGINLAGIIFANVGEANMPELTSKRTMASVPFGGKYRLVDFSLSNMSNSGINNVAIIARKHFHSLMDHVGNGKAWDLSKRRSGLTILSPYRGHSFRHRIEAMYHLDGYFEHLKEEYILITNSNFAANVDYTKMFEQHLSTGADLTLMYKEMEIPKNAVSPIVIDTDAEGRITSLLINPGTEGVCKNSTCSMIINKNVLLELVRNCMSANALNFRKNLLQDNVDKIKMYGYEFKGHMSIIHSVDDYFRENMKLVNKEIRDELFDLSRPIYTKVRDDAPSRYGLTSKVKGSLVAQGCLIEGEVENCILSKGVHIGKGAVVKNCIIMQDAVIKDGATLDYVIVDKDVVVTEGQSLAGAETYPIYIAKQSTV